MSQVNDFNIELLTALTSKLTGLMNKETQAMKLMRISEIALLQQEKNEIAAALEKQQFALRSNQENRADLTEEQKTLLKQAAVEFDTAIQSYQEELYKAKKVNEMVINKIVEIVKDHIMKNRSYGANGAKSLSGTELAQNTPALKYNTQA